MFLVECESFANNTSTGLTQRAVRVLRLKRGLDNQYMSKVKGCWNTHPTHNDG